MKNNAELIDAVGVDMYNQTLTKHVSKCLNSIATDSDHVPVVICCKKNVFECEAMSHDLFSTKFCKDGKVDTLSRTDYKEPPVVAYSVNNGKINEEQ